eukprot:9483016-Pyramimonas_sp.AAC.1
MDFTDLQQAQCGEAAPLLNAATGLRQCGTVVFTVALSPRAKMIHVLNAVADIYEPCASRRPSISWGETTRTCIPSNRGNITN